MISAPVAYDLSLDLDLATIAIAMIIERLKSSVVTVGHGCG
jgi:hypothetical protein